MPGLYSLPSETKKNALSVNRIFLTCAASEEYVLDFFGYPCGHCRPLHSYQGRGVLMGGLMGPALSSTPGGPKTHDQENGLQISEQAGVRGRRGKQDHRHGLRCQREHAL